MTLKAHVRPSTRKITLCLCSLFPFRLNSYRGVGSSYCAVTNGAALAFGDTLGANGSIPSGYFELYPFDGAGGSHTGGRYIENNTNTDG